MNVALRRYVWPLFAGTIFLILFGMSAYWIMYQSRTYMDQLIASDVVILKNIFERIDASCGIRSFEYDKNPINFLNVKSFAGSEVGPMNLHHPKKWQGPYLKDNLTIQEKEYQIVRTPKGYFIAPGDGVRLGSGKTTGRDIMLNKDTDFLALAKQKGMLRSKDGKALVAQLELGKKKASQKPDRDINFLSPDIVVQVLNSD